MNILDHMIDFTRRNPETCGSRITTRVLISITAVKTLQCNASLGLVEAARTSRIILRQQETRPGWSYGPIPSHRAPELVGVQLSGYINKFNQRREWKDGGECLCP